MSLSSPTLAQHSLLQLAFLPATGEFPFPDFNLYYVFKVFFSFFFWDKGVIHHLISQCLCGSSGEFLCARCLLTLLEIPSHCYGVLFLCLAVGWDRIHVSDTDHCDCEKSPEKQGICTVTNANHWGRTAKMVSTSALWSWNFMLRDDI